MLADINFGMGGYVEWNRESWYRLARNTRTFHPMHHPSVADVLHHGTPEWMEVRSGLLTLAFPWRGARKRLAMQARITSCVLITSLLPAKGGPNHDNTTNFGDSSLLHVFPDGSAALEFTSWYWVMGHLSRFARPGALRVDASGPGFAASPADYDAIRAYTLGQSTNGTLPLVASAFVAPGGDYASVVVLNAGNTSLKFKLADLQSGGGVRATQAAIPARSIQTYTFAV